ncbi:MAG: adenosylcobinamide-GDP ribazoletransferase, partial [Atopostipes sp.]|nr:adenosylcobinamide-GDP ribazoletransferase [Atopostipes sp.]
MKSYYYGLILNLQFFTTIPIPVEVPVTDKNIERSIRLFPLLGLFLGIVYSLLAYVFQVYSPFSNLLISFLIWFLTIVLTGGLHIDGWMDSADAFFSYQEKRKRLEIMADPRMGAFGVIA